MQATPHLFQMRVADAILVTLSRASATAMAIVWVFHIGWGFACAGAHAMSEGRVNRPGLERATIDAGRQRPYLSVDDRRKSPDLNGR